MPSIAPHKSGLSECGFKYKDDFTIILTLDLRSDSRR